ncbi:MAG: phage protease [Phycisphaerae bacterium]
MTSESQTKERTEASEASYVALDAGAGGFAELPERVLIAPWGTVESTQGRFVVDESAATATVAAFAAHGTDVPIDYEHQTLGGAFGAPNGQAPAAGWIKKLIPVAPAAEGDGSAAGLWAEVEWTPQAREQLRSRQYRYLSPVALVRRSDGRMIGLHSAALTNKPAIAAMRPIVNRSEAEAEAELVALRTLLSVGMEASAGEVAELAAARIRTLQSALDARRAADRVSGALAAGKLTAGQREWATALALRDPAVFDEWAAGAPVVVMAGRVAPPAEGKLEMRRAALERRARQEYRGAGAWLAGLCDEEAFVSQAVRELD